MVQRNCHARKPFVKLKMHRVLRVNMMNQPALSGLL